MKPRGNLRYYNSILSHPFEGGVSSDRLAGDGGSSKVRRKAFKI